MIQHLLILVIVASTMTSIAAGSESNDSSVGKLIGATQIETGQIYESAEPSELAQAFEHVLRRPDAKDALVRIFKEAKSDAGRIYALTGLHRIDENEYRTLLRQMKPESKIRAMWYDVIRIFAVQDLIKMIESGEFERILQVKQK